MFCFIQSILNVLKMNKRESTRVSRTSEKLEGESESFRVDRYRCIEGRCLHQAMSEKTKVTKTKTALKQETYNLSDLKHDLHCGFVELGGSVTVSVSS